MQNLSNINVKFFKFYSLALLSVILPACTVNPVDTTSYTPSVAGYVTGEAESRMASSSLLPDSAASSAGVSKSTSNTYSAFSQADNQIIKKGALFTGNVPVSYGTGAQPAVGITPAVIQASGYTVPVVINTPPIGGSAYGSFSNSEGNVIQQNVFGVPPQASPVQGQAPAYGYGYPPQQLQR